MGKENPLSVTPFLLSITYDPEEKHSNLHLSKRILVAGGAGFLGSHLCDRPVEDGNDVLSLDITVFGDESQTRSFCYATNHHDKIVAGIPRGYAISLPISALNAIAWQLCLITNRSVLGSRVRKRGKVAMRQK